MMMPSTLSSALTATRPGWLAIYKSPHTAARMLSSPAVDAAYADWLKTPQGQKYGDLREESSKKFMRTANRAELHAEEIAEAAVESGEPSLMQAAAVILRKAGLSDEAAELERRAIFEGTQEQYDEVNQQDDAE
jgi:hypothetical protein